MTKIFGMIVISLQITSMFARKKYHERHSSEESIENLLYFQDCKEKKTTAAPIELQRLQKLETTTPVNPCPCPRMCCSMCCDCGIKEGPQSFASRPMSQLRMPFETNPQPMMQRPNPSMAAQSQIQRNVQKKKRMKMMMNQLPQGGRTPPESMLPPIGARRALGFTRENIKNLISQDQDIKKILKDLVKVTMQKVDLVDAIKTRRSMMETTTEAANYDDDF